MVSKNIFGVSFCFFWTEQAVFWSLSKCFKVSWVIGVLNLSFLKAQIKSWQRRSHCKATAVPRWPLQHIDQTLHSQAFVHVLVFEKLMKTEACTRHARPDSALTAFTLQPQTLGLQLVSCWWQAWEETRAATEFTEDRTETGQIAWASTVRQWKTQRPSS